MRIVTWNIRGLMGGEKRRVAKEFIRRCKIDVFCIQEIKCEEGGEDLLREIGGARLSKGIVVPAEGRSGGLLLLWNEFILEEVGNQHGLNYITATFRNKEDGFLWDFTGVYGPQGREDKKALWELLLLQHSQSSKPWCIAGDFNAVAATTERSGALSSDVSMLDFQDFIAAAGLIDVYTPHSVFTWSSFRADPSLSRLDRFLISVDWEDHFPHLQAECLHRPSSDHKPVLLKTSCRGANKTRFRLEKYWLREESFREVVSQAWQGEHQGSSAMAQVVTNLKRVRQALIQWGASKTLPGKVAKDRILEHLEGLDALEEAGLMDEDDRAHRDKLKAEYEEILLKEEIYWKQRAKDRWIKEGDRNTAYFQRIASGRRRINCIKNLKVGGILFSTKGEIRREVQEFYSSLFTEEAIWRPSLQHDLLPSLSEEERGELVTPFYEEEVRGAIFSLAGDKAPGPDGLPMLFFQHCWEIIKSLLCKALLEFQQGKAHLRGSNKTLIVLIPKKVGADSLADFRPISLLNGVYKIVTKLLASRLEKVVDRVVSCNQGAFIRGRHIQENFLTAHEAVHFMKQQQERGIVLKLDFEKAYDRVNWEYLYAVLRCMGFGETWVRWVRACISTASFAVLVNGETTDTSLYHRGLRQGDPMAPLLFVLVVQVLSRMWDRAQREGLISGFPIDIGGGHLSHLQYADDTVLFFSGPEEQFFTARFLLEMFHELSGIRVNFHKSFVVGINTEEQAIQRVAVIMGCQVGKFPITYLGLPLSPRCIYSRDWDKIINRFETRLAGWKGRLLSYGGRLVLCHSVLDSLPTYFLSIFKIPKKVVRRLDSIRSNFFWGGQEGRRMGLHAVNWRRVCTSKESGGLGLKNLGDFNLALLSKWLWKLRVTDSAMWRDILCYKYYRIGRAWDFYPDSAFSVSPIWKGILQASDITRAGMRLSIGNGSRCLFWEDRWCGAQSLSSLFPKLAAVAARRGVAVGQLYHTQPTGGGVWAPCFRRNLRDDEIKELHRFFSLLQGVQLSSSEEDTWTWIWDMTGRFTVKSAYRIIADGGIRSTWVRHIWKPISPLKVKVLIWRITLGRLPTSDRLARFMEDIHTTCALCGVEEESLNHLLITCTYTMEVWEAILRKVKIHLLFPQEVPTLLNMWGNRINKQEDLKVWWLILHATFWAIWGERNRRIFRRQALSADRISSFVCFKVREWWMAAFSVSPCNSTLLELLQGE